MSYDIKCLLQKVFRTSKQARSETFPIEEPSRSTYGRVENKKKYSLALQNIALLGFSLAFLVLDCLKFSRQILERKKGICFPALGLLHRFQVLCRLNPNF